MPRLRVSSLVAYLGLDRTTGAAFWFVIAAVGMTWPLAAALTRDVPWDFGDPLLNCWIIGWTAERLLRGVTGDPWALVGLWHGNIFHPEPLTLAYSELLYAQVLQVLPVYAATRNLILSYNLLFISTFALSALGTYLFVRQLTGDWRAALVAGLAFGFAPNRAAQAPHLQVLSSQWMPFALYGFRRYLDTGTRRALSGATAAVILQNWSCGYHLLFFALLLPPYLLWELYARGRLRDAAAWRGLATAAVAVSVATIPVMWPYLALRQIQPGFKRNLSEIEFYSADVYGYLTASPNLRVWGRLQAFARPEGELFPGSAVLALSTLAVGAAAMAGLRQWRARTAAGANRETPMARRLTAWGGLSVAGAALVALAWVIATGGKMPEDRLARARLDVMLQQQVDRATRRVAERGYQAGPFRGAMEGFAWEKFDPLYPERSLKMVSARVFEQIDPNDAGAADRAAEALRAEGIQVERDGVDRLRFSDGSLVDVLRNAAVAAGIPGATITWTWLVVDEPARTLAPWLLLALAASLTLALLSAPEWRRAALAALRSPVGFFLIVAIVAWWLSLGPVARTKGAPISGFGLYGYVVAYLPGFDGLRVVARLAVLVFLSLAILAGLGLAMTLNRFRRAAVPLTVVAAAWVLADGFVAPIPRNANWTDEDLAYPSALELPFSRAPELYRVLRGLPQGSALIEFPFGTVPWEIRYTYRSTYHWRPIVNGFSGWTPPSYRRLRELRRPLENPDRAWATLAASGATHVVVHRDAYPAPPQPRSGEGDAVSAWLEQHGSVRVAETGDAVVLALPPRN